MMESMSPELLLRMTHLESIEREQKAVRWAQQAPKSRRRRHHRHTR